MRKQSGQVAVGILIGILALLLVVGIAVGGYQLNWWLKSQSVNRNAKINRTSYEVQQTYREEVQKDLQNVATDDREIADPAYAASLAEIKAARIADVNVTCDHISRLTTSGAGVDPTVTAFNTRECLVP